MKKQITALTFTMAFLCGNAPAEPEALRGVCYSPFRAGQSPDQGVFPGEAEIREDLAFIAASGIAQKIRTYGSGGIQAKIPEIALELKLECWPGAWLGRNPGVNERELSALVGVGRKRLANTPVLIVGNEVLLRNDLTERQLLDAIERVRKETGLPVAYAETAGVWLKHPEVAREVDVLLVHLYPYWDGIHIERAISALVARFQELRKAFPGKRIVIGETGWPSRGEVQGAAVPSPANQARHFQEFLAASREAEIDYFYFSLFSEGWKTVQEGQRGAHWGLLSDSGQPGREIAGILGERCGKGFRRAKGLPPAVTPLNVPAFVYRDGESDDNRFRPTNWMGETRDLKIDEFCRDHPLSGEHCLKIVFKPSAPVSWAGIYWVGPAFNHWGQFPGYELKGAKQLVFWARGEKGGEIVEFKAGGMNSRGMPFRDSFGPVSLGQPVILTREWRRYVIDLRGQNTSSLLGGFCFALNAPSNRRETAFFLDQIVLAGDELPSP